MKLSKKDIFYYLLLLMAGGVFYLLNLRTPFSHDDYAYCFFYGPDYSAVHPTDIRVTGWWQMVQSIWNHYHSVNGRFSSHLLLQTFCAFWGKGVFNIVNTLVFLLLLHTLVVMTSRKKSVSMLALVFLATLYLLPFPGQTMLWMAGSLNYLWPATFSLVFVYCLLKYNGAPISFWKHASLFLAALAVGWGNESISIPVSFGLFFYFLFNRNSFRNGAVSSYLGYTLGALLIIVSPGTWHRMTGWESVLNQQTPLQALFVHTYNFAWGAIHSLVPLIAIAFALLVKRKDLWRFSFLRKSVLAWLFLGFACFVFALGWDVERVYFGFSAFCLAIILRTINPIVARTRHYDVLLSSFLIAMCVMPSIKALRDTDSYLAYDKSIYTEVQQAPSKCIVKERPFLNKSRYVYATMLKPDRFNFHNRVKAFYYGKEFIQSLPEDLYDCVCSGGLGSALSPANVFIDGHELLSFGHYWLLPVDEIPAKQLKAVCYYESNPSSLHVHQKIIRYLLNTLDGIPEELPCYGIESGEKYYLIIPKQNEQNLIRIQIQDYKE